jgi:hypothetical protein
MGCNCLNWFRRGSSCTTCGTAAPAPIQSPCGTQTTYDPYSQPTMMAPQIIPGPQ